MLSGVQKKLRSETVLLAGLALALLVIPAQLQAQAPYCLPVYDYGTADGDYVGRVTLGSINNITGGAPAPFYTYYNTLSTDLIAGSTHTLILGGGSWLTSSRLSAWIDFNQDGLFTASERLGFVVTGPAPAVDTIEFTVPAGATPGVTRMRVREWYTGNWIGPCDQEYFGETEDYNINILTPPPCTGMPTAGTVPATISACGQSTATLTATGATLAGGIVYQWQSSTDGGITWLNITGANTTIYTVSLAGWSAGTIYRLQVTCTGSGLSGVSAGTEIISTQAPAASNNTPVCLGQTVQLNATGNFDPATTFLWTGPNGFSSTLQSPAIPNASWSNMGNYHVTATLNGCSSMPSSTYVAVAQGPGQLTVTGTPGCIGGTLVLVANGAASGNYAWSGPNGFTGNSNSVSVPNYQPVNFGTYTVTSGYGACASVGQITLGAPAGPVVPAGISVCPGSSLTLTANSALQAVGYSWTGPNGFTSTQQNPVIANPGPAHSGLYTVVADYGNCLSPPSVIPVSVTGTLTLSANNNGPVNQGGTLILTAGGTAGNYSWTGPNNFSATGQNPYIQQAQSAHSGNYTVTLESPGCTTVTAVTNAVVIPMKTITGTVYNDLNDNGIQDSGETGLSGKLVKLQPGNYYAYTDIQGNYTAYVPGPSYTLNIANLLSYQTSNPATLTVSVVGVPTSAGNNLGIHTAAVNNLAVSITEVLTPAPGFITYQRINFGNLGSTLISGTVRLLPDTLLSLSTNTTSGYTTSGDTLTWTFNNLLPGQIAHKYFYATVHASTPLGTILNSAAWVTPLAGDADSTNNSYTLTQLVTGSWDPNDKAVQPAGPIALHEVAAGKELVYTVRFQNTGTAPAVNVLVIDTLSANLDLSTFQMLSSSHNYELTVRENGILEWRFNNIMLPDSNANEPASHGDVHYRIMPKTNLVVGDVIENTAHIFFDFNEAVVTNTTHTPVGILAAPALTETANLHLFPNPNNGQAMLEFTAANQAETTVSVLNLLGQEVWQLKKTTEAGEVEIPVELEQQPAGIYLVKVQQNGKVYSAKLIRQ